MKNTAHIGLIDAYMHRHRPECARVLADFYWRVLLSASLGILIIAVGYGTSKLSSVIGESESALSQSAGTVQPAATLNKTQLQSTLSAFSEREEMFNSLKTGAQRISDPSR